MAKFNSFTQTRSGRATAKFPIAVLIVSLVSGTAIGFFAGGGSKVNLSMPKVVATAEPEAPAATVEAAPAPKPEIAPPVVAKQQAVAPVMDLPPIETAPPTQVTEAKPMVMKQPEIQPMPPKMEPEPKKEERVITFKEHVLPVFQARCIECHGDPSIKSGLDMRTLAKIEQGGNGGPGLVAGKPEMSYLFERIEDGSMPPRGKSAMSKSEMNLIREWIATGAK